MKKKRITGSVKRNGTIRSTRPKTKAKPRRKAKPKKSKMSKTTKITLGALGSAGALGAALLAYKKFKKQPPAAVHSPFLPTHIDIPAFTRFPGADTYVQEDVSTLKKMVGTSPKALSPSVKKYGTPTKAEPWVPSPYLLQQKPKIPVAVDSRGRKQYGVKAKEGGTKRRKRKSSKK